MRIVTSGAPYLDIDAYAGCIAYAELLERQGIESIAASTAPYNESIPKTVLSWGSPIVRSITHSPEDTYTLIDISDPAFFDTFVDEDSVVEVIDHHQGYEEFWQGRIQENATIEFIGAACTLVFEKWQQANKLGHLSQRSARLLICGILDNTLNFGAKITTERDKAAYEQLKETAMLPQNWVETYFLECQDTILNNLLASIQNDTKRLRLGAFNTDMNVGQLALWDTESLLRDRYEDIHNELSAAGQNWFLNAINIKERRSYFVTDVREIQEWLSAVLGIQFESNIAVANRMWLRKEMIKQASL